MLEHRRVQFGLFILVLAVTVLVVVVIVIYVLAAGAMEVGHLHDDDIVEMGLLSLRS